jgi:toxin ParE1/3/4
MPRQRYQVLLTDGAEQDLEGIVDYIARHDSALNAERVLDHLLQASESLTDFPERGSQPRELLRLGIREYRQTIFKPYRMIYRIIDKTVYIYLIADGRRNMQALLERRLLGR